MVFKNWVESEQISLPDFSPDQMPDASYEVGDVDAKITLCVDKLYEINADIVTEFIKKARAEIVKRLNLMAKANRLILRTIVRHPSISLEELEGINLDMFASLLKKAPENIDDQTVLNLLRQARKETDQK